MPPPGGTFVPGHPGPGGPYPPMIMMPGWIPPELAQQQHQQYIEGGQPAQQQGYGEGQPGEFFEGGQSGDAPEYGNQQEAGDMASDHQGPQSHPPQSANGNEQG